MPTVVLLPGGMGSQLDYSHRRYRNDSDLPFERYDPIWMDPGILFQRDALKLSIQSTGRDVKDHIVIPDGPLNFLVNPYDGAERFFRERLHWNYICFGFDWRRPITESAGFLELFLRRLGERVKQQRGESPLSTATLLCHSLGGLVALAFLHRIAKQANKIHEWLDRVVTIGTPFYGTSDHMIRYYKGQEALNWIYGAEPIARVTGTLPGPYILLYPSRALYQRDALKLNKSSFPLKRYPMRDAANQGRELDPFGAAAATRYPKWVCRKYLQSAERIRKRITGPLPPELSQRVFHIRSGLVKMPVEEQWYDVDGGHFNPERDDNPVSESLAGPGDGTVPAWSARLVDTPPQQIYNLKLARKHGDLVEHVETLNVVSDLITHGRLPKKLNVPDELLGVERAQVKEMRSFIDGVVSKQFTKSDSTVSDQAFWRRFLEEASLC